MKALNFDKTADGMLPAIVQDHQTHEILMLAYINKTAWELTLKTGKAHYWSRSRNKLWLKGETSGHIQIIRRILVDCDEDTVVYQVEQVGQAACHTGHRSCFYRRIEGDHLVTEGLKVFDPEAVYGKKARRVEATTRSTGEMVMKQLKLGLPKGSLEVATIELFEKAGWLIKPAARNYFPKIDDPELDCSICRPQEMSRYVEGGMLDAGITGKDWTMENLSDTVLVCDLIYSKVSRRPTRWVIAVAGDSGITTLEDLEGKKISTELVNVTRRFFAERNINVDIEFSWGATEAKVVSGLADAIVEVTETESTIRAHGLRIIHELMQSNTQFIANQDAWNDPWKREKIENIALLLQGALRADRIVGLKMNVSSDKIDEIVAILPSINAPTVASLYNQDWYSVETVVSEDIVRDLIPRLKKLGAEGIIEYSLNKVI